MSFLNPAFLGALALAGVPLLIHLIRKRRQRVIAWAAMEFLRQSQKKQRRRLRIEELILLGLRMLIVALAAFAFARPVLRALGIPLLGQNARVYAVIVLDNSLSMAQRDPADGKTAFQRAQEGAEAVLTRVLKPGDSASLVLLSSKPDVVIASPSFDLARVRQQIRALHPGDRATDYGAAAQAVVKLLRTSKAPVKEVYWLTDDQANGWEGAKRDATKTVWGDLTRQARLNWVSVGAPVGQRDNLAVTAPTVGREIVTPALPVRIEAQIENWGAKPRSDTLVNLILDGKPSGTTRVSLPAGGTATARFVASFPKPGLHTGQITLADADRVDGLARDNHAPFVVAVRDRLRVLIQDTHPQSDPSRSDTFYLQTALAPGGAQETFAPVLHAGSALGSGSLGGYAAIAITDIGSLTESDQRLLADWVRAGGGLLLFPGNGTEARRVNADWSASGLLPARLGTRLTRSEQDAPTLNPATITSPALALFQDKGTLNLGAARFSTYFPLSPITPKPEEEAANPNGVRTLIRFSSGEPAFVERQVGAGRVILAASSAGQTWNQLPLKASYVLLVYQLMSHLAQGATGAHNLTQDAPFTLRLPLNEANKPVQVTLPDGKTVSRTSSLGAGGVAFAFGDTAQSGLYQVAVTGGKTREAFAVALPSKEANLTYADPAPAVQAAGANPALLTVARTPAELQTSVQRSRYGQEFWRSLIWAVVPLLFLESLLAQRFGRRG